MTSPGDTPDTEQDYLDSLINERLRSMDDIEFAMLVARTRPPATDPKDLAAETLKKYLDRNRIQVKPRKK